MPSVDFLFPADPTTRALARALHGHTSAMPIVSPHGHVDPGLLSANEPIDDIARELVTRNHYILRMLNSAGVPLESLGVAPIDGGDFERDGRAIWSTLAKHYHLFRATPSKLWFDHTLENVFGIDEPLNESTADAIYDAATKLLHADEYRPRALLDRFGIEFLATTEGALDPLTHHGAMAADGMHGRVVPTFRPDDVIDPDRSDFAHNLEELGELTGENTRSWDGYLRALRARRSTFIAAGATASDHGHPTALTADLSPTDAEALFGRITNSERSVEDSELFRAQMLTEMATMSTEDGLVMQLHAGSWRNHNRQLAGRFGPDMGADIPTSISYVGPLKAILDRHGNNPSLTLIVYTLDESTYSRELAPLAGHYPALKLGPPWWFHDSPEGIRRFRQLTTETAGFANTVGFNDDARSLLTIPARHDLVRRIDAGFLAGMIVDGRLSEDDAFELAEDLAHGLARDAFRVGTRP